jgi:hypothetical protein
LRGAVAFTAAAALASAFPLTQVDFESGLTPLTNTIVLDFVSPYSSPGQARYSYLATVQQVKKLLGPGNYIPLLRLLREFGPTVFSETRFKREVMSKYPEYGLVMGGMISFASHGASVVACHQRFARTLGCDPAPVIIPVQENLTLLDLHDRDNLNNPAVLLRLGVEPLIEQLHRYPEQPIVNLSLQVGTFAVVHKRRNVYPAYSEDYDQLQASLLTHYAEENPEDGELQYYFYDPALYTYAPQHEGPRIVSKATGEAATAGADGFVMVAAAEFDQFVATRRNELLQQSFYLRELEIPPFYEIRGAYTGDLGAENMQELFRLVNAFPTKLFVVAAGNYGDDLRPWRTRFAHRWPENLLVVGHWSNAQQYPRMYDAYNVFGADLYFDGTSYGRAAGSSMATAVVSAAAAVLWEGGATLPSIKATLLALCDEVEIETTPAIPLGSTNREDYILAELERTQALVKVFNEAKLRSFLTQAPLAVSSL